MKKVKNWWPKDKVDGSFRNSYIGFILNLMIKSLPIGGLCFFKERKAMNTQVPITPAGFKAIEEELKERKTVTRPEIVESIATAREHGDLKENAEYHAAKEQQSFNEGRIKELEGAISAAQVIDPSKFSGDQIKFGAHVLIVDEETDEERKLQIVGEYETDSDNGKISVTSPVARALIGKSAGDSVKVVTPKGTVDYEVLEVSYS